MFCDFLFCFFTSEKRHEKNKAAKAAPKRVRRFNSALPEIPASQVEVVEDVDDSNVENAEELEAGFSKFFFGGGVHHVFFQTVHVGFVEFDEVAEPAFQTGWVADDDEFAEPPSKTRRITKDMSEEDIAKVKQDRLDRKRANSRAWHAKFESKGATCQPSFCFKGIVSKKSPFPLKLETLGFEVLKSSGSKDGDNETNPEDGEADVANVGADAEGSSPKTLNDARWAFETWQNLVTSLELST